MLRYRIVSVDPLNEEDCQPLNGTYPMDVVQAVAAACYADPTCHRLAIAEPVQIRHRRHTYYVESAGKRWHIVADSPQQAAREAARRGRPARVWYCRDDQIAGSPPIAEVIHATA